jgi:phospholipase/carboxylesterase
MFAKGTQEAPLHYLVRPASVSTPNPAMLILLHGLGSNEKDLFSFANDLPKDLLVIAVRAPFTLSNESYAWYHVDFSTPTPIIQTSEELNSRQLLLAFIDWAVEAYQSDANRVYLAGFSQGSIMSYSIAITHPEKLKGIAAFSGRVLEEVKPLVPTSPMNKVHMFISHGTKDPVLPISSARDAKLLFHKKLDLSYHEYDDVHTINQQMFLDFKSWLISNLH